MYLCTDPFIYAKEYQGICLPRDFLPPSSTHCELGWWPRRLLRRLPFGETGRLRTRPPAITNVPRPPRLYFIVAPVSWQLLFYFIYFIYYLIMGQQQIALCPPRDYKPSILISTISFLISSSLLYLFFGKWNIVVDGKWSVTKALQLKGNIKPVPSLSKEVYEKHPNFVWPPLRPSFEASEGQRCPHTHSLSFPCLHFPLASPIATPPEQRELYIFKRIYGNYCVLIKYQTFVMIYTREKKEKKDEVMVVYSFSYQVYWWGPCHSHVVCFWWKVLKYCNLSPFPVCNYPACNIIDSNNSYLLYNIIIYFIYYYCLSYTDATCCRFLHWGLSLSWLMQILEFSLSLNKFFVFCLWPLSLAFSLF